MISQLFLVFFLLSQTTISFSGENVSNQIVLQETAYSNWIKQISTVSHSRPHKVKTNKMKPCLTLTVNKKANKNKKGKLDTIQKAIDSLPIVNICRVVISIHAGTYREKVDIPAYKSYISLEGAGADKTIIEWSDTADAKGKNGLPLGTFGSATIAINSPYFIAKNITFKNIAPMPASGALGKQAVAMRISGDKAAFIGCKFIGTQDTLYDHVGRHYFKDCYIEGSVDFIFGNGLSLYNGCHLNAIGSSYGALTAQKRDNMLEETGFSFIKCKVTGSGALYLGRAWGSFSRVIFAYTYMDRIITSRGWYDWGDRNRDMTVFYGQYKCWGPGADFGARVKWSRELTQEEAKPFVSLNFIDGFQWLPRKLL